MADMQQMLQKDPTDVIFMSPDLDENDRSMAQAVFQANMPKMKRLLKKEGIFSEVKEKELADRLSQGIKAILAHKLRKRRSIGVN